MRRGGGPARRRAAVAVVAIAIAIAIASIVAVGFRRDASPRDAPPLATDGAAPRPGSPSAPIATTDDRILASPTAPASASVAPDAAAANCDGQARVDVASPESHRRAVREAQRELVDRLEAGDERQRAVALLLRQQGDFADAAPTEPSQECMSDAACMTSWWKRAEQSQRSVAVPTARALARMAVSTRDPFVYAAGLEACRTIDDPARSEAPACGLLSSRQWARLDDDNAVAWLRVAADAADRKDAAAVAEALARVAAAPANRLYGDASYGIAAAALPDRLPGLVRDETAFLAVSIVAGWHLPRYEVVSRHCSAEAMRDSNRWQLCDGVAHSLVDRGTTLFDFAFGIRLAERVGWPAERLRALQDEKEALFRAEALASPDGVDPTSCAAFRAGEARLRRRAVVGELAAARELVAASGRSIRSLAEDGRAARAAATAAASAAHAASSASTPG